MPFTFRETLQRSLRYLFFHSCCEFPDMRFSIFVITKIEKVIKMNSSQENTIVKKW